MKERPSATVTRSLPLGVISMSALLIVKDGIFDVTLRPVSTSTSENVSLKIPRSE